MPRIFERRMLRMIHRPVNDSGIWRARYGNELYAACYELDIAKVVNMGRLVWLGHFVRVQELDLCRKVT